LTLFVLSFCKSFFSLTSAILFGTANISFDVSYRLNQKDCKSYFKPFADIIIPTLGELRQEENWYL